MLKTQEYLRKNTIEELIQEFKLEATYSPTYTGEPLVILNYHQIDSPKHSPVTKECRGLVLDYHNYDIVALPFSRFFNYGEWREDINKFDWNNFSTQTKEDGSLAIVYNYKGSWRINTRGSFANAKSCEACPYTWEELFFLTINEKQLDNINPDYTLIFELCSPWNKVVRFYPEPVSYLLTIRNRKTGEEIDSQGRQGIARSLSCKLPDEFSYSCPEELIRYLDEECDDPTFEGFVVKDKNNLRIKFKSKNYLRLHSMRGNGSNLFAPKNLVPFILEGELGELTSIYPETIPYIEKYQAILDSELRKIEEVWGQIKNRNTQKGFALDVMRLLPKWQSILFNCRKLNIEPRVLWRTSHELVTKSLDNELSRVSMNTVASQLEGE